MNSRLLPFGAARAAAAALLFLPPARTPQPQSIPAIAQVWPTAQRGTVPATLSDGTS
jgi:hypothetical protein